MVNTLVIVPHLQALKSGQLFVLHEVPQFHMKLGAFDPTIRSPTATNHLGSSHLINPADGSPKEKALEGREGTASRRC